MFTNWVQSAGGASSLSTAEEKSEEKKPRLRPDAATLYPIFEKWFSPEKQKKFQDLVEVADKEPGMLMRELV